MSAPVLPGIASQLRNISTLVETTPEHPFFVEGVGWVPAGELLLGDRVRSADGTGVVEALVSVASPQVMYNLTVAEAHTFFVGDGQWLVHNRCNGVIESFDEFLEVNRNRQYDASSFDEAAEAWAAYLESAQTGDALVVGRQIDTRIASEWPDHQVLARDYWSLNINDSWVQGGIDRGATFYLGSPQTRQTLWDPINNRETVFARELRQLQEAGYIQQGDYMIPPP